MIGAVSSLLTGLAAAKYLFGGGSGDGGHRVYVTPEQMESIMRRHAEVDSVRQAKFAASNGGHVVNWVSDTVHYLFYDVNGIVFTVSVIILSYVFGRLFKLIYCKTGDCSGWCYDNTVGFSVWACTGLTAMLVLFIRFLVWFETPYVA